METLITKYSAGLLAECKSVIFALERGKPFTPMRLEGIRVRDLVTSNEHVLYDLLEKPHGGSFFLLGTTGIGKTITLYRTAEHFANKLMGESGSRLPFVLRADSVAERGYMIAMQDEFHEKAAITSKPKNQHIDAEALLQEKFEKGTLLLLIDMFDGLTHQGVLKFTEEMVRFVTANSQLPHEQNIVLVASRAEPVEEVRFRFKAFHFLELPPLSTTEIERYVRAELGPKSSDAADKFLSIFWDPETRLKGLVELPMYLVMAVEAYDPKRDVDENRIRLRHEAAIHSQFIEEVMRKHLSAKYQEREFDIREPDMSHALLKLGELTSSRWRAGGSGFILPSGFTTEVFTEGREFPISRSDLVEMGLLNKKGGVKYPSPWRFFIAYYQSGRLDEFEPAKWVLMGEAEVPVLVAGLLSEPAAFEELWRRLKSDERCRRLFRLQARCLLASDHAKERLGDFIKELFKELDEEYYSFSILEGLSEVGDRVAKMIEGEFKSLSHNQKRRILYFLGLKGLRVADSVVRDIMKTTKAPEDRHLLYHLVRAIGESRQKEYTAELQSLLTSRDAVVRADSRWALEQCGVQCANAGEQTLERDRKVLLRQLRDSRRRHWERAHAAGALGRMGDLRNVTPLCHQLRSETSEKAISYICEAIATIFRMNRMAERERKYALLTVVEGLGLVTTRDLYYQATTISELYQEPVGNISLTFGLGFSKDPYDVTTVLTGFLGLMEKGDDPELAKAAAEATKRLRAPYPQLGVWRGLQ